MSKTKDDPIVANAKFGRLEMGYASFDEESDGIRIAAFTKKPDLHVSFALSCEEAIKLAQEIVERANRRLEICGRAREPLGGK